MLQPEVTRVAQPIIFRAATGCESHQCQAFHLNVIHKAACLLKKRRRDPAAGFIFSPFDLRALPTSAFGAFKNTSAHVHCHTDRLPVRPFAYSLNLAWEWHDPTSRSRLLAGGLYHDTVLDVLDTLHFTGQLRRPIRLAFRIYKAAELNDSFESLNFHLHRANHRVPGVLRLHLCGDRGIVDIFSCAFFRGRAGATADANHSNCQTETKHQAQHAVQGPVRLLCDLPQSAPRSRSVCSFHCRSFSCLWVSLISSLLLSTSHNTDT